jgi:hypothetical protein
MKITGRRAAPKDDDFLTTVARSIGSTLGAVAAKVNPSPRKSRQRLPGRERTSKRLSASRAGRRRVARAPLQSSKASRLNHKNRKKYAK